MIPTIAPCCHIAATGAMQYNELDKPEVVEEKRIDMQKACIEEHVETMVNNLVSILGNKILAIYLYGSVVLNDYKLGWSDIDILCLTEGSLTEQEEERCLALRQTLVSANNDDIYRTFEGAIVSLHDFISGIYSKVIYWGTSGQRITDKYSFDVFSLYELINCGQLVLGVDIRGKLTCPTYSELRNGVINHYQVIRKYALNTDDSLYSCGWLLDVARCVYTLRTGRVIAKTKAGEWALEQDLCPDRNSLIKTIQVRNNPIRYKNRKDTKSWLSTLGPQVQAFADVLEREIKLTE